MDRHALDDDLLLWPILAINLDGFNAIQNVVSRDYFAEDGVLAVQMWCRSEANKELAPIGRWPFVGHADYATAVMSKGRPDLVLKRLVPDGG